MKLKFLFLLVISALALSCKKDKTPTTAGTWNLKNYSVTYFDANGSKVFESKPEELLQFSKVEIRGDSVSIPQVVSAQKSQTILAVKSPIKTNPAVLVFLSVKKSLNTVSVDFGTASELNAKEWIIERSSGAVIDFLPLGVIQAKGNSNTVSNYSFIDHSPLFGLNYYRLIQVDLDGRSTVMGIVLTSMNFSLSTINGNTTLPVNLVDYTFKQVAISFSGNSKMVWSGEAENPQYIENGVSKTAASATLNMEFTK